MPGIMEDPGCILGRLISLKPVLGPDESSRKSLQILESLTESRFKTPESCT